MNNNNKQTNTNKNKTKKTENDSNPTATPRVEFAATAVSVLESAKIVQVGLVRSKNLTEKVTVR